MTERLYHVTTGEVVGLALAIVGVILWLVGALLLLKYSGTGDVS